MTYVRDASGRDLGAALFSRAEVEKRKLDAAARNKIPTGQFAGPNRTYPIHDASHARNAIARATQQENAGNLTAAQADRIRARARAALARFNGKKAAPYVKAMTTSQGRMKRPARKPDSTIARVQAKPAKPSGAAKLPGRLASAKAALKPGQSSGSRYRI